VTGLAMCDYRFGERHTDPTPSRRLRKGTMTYFKPKNMGDVRLRLGSIADAVPVKLGPGVKLPPVRSVGELRRLTAWPVKHRLVIERADVLEVRVELP
jgi:hypothetical protein